MPTFRKAERITSLKEIEYLFERGRSSSVQAWPLRAVFQITAEPQAGAPPVKVLVSVAKKRLRHAVDRNRAKRQTREAYRLHKQPLFDALAVQKKQMRLAFIWLATEPQPTEALFSAMSRIVSTIVRRMQPDTEKNRPFVQSADAKQDNT